MATATPVSIRARPGGRAMPYAGDAHPPFNIVSIRARPGGRAMPSIKVHPVDSGSVSIRARPGGRAMPLLSITRARRLMVSIRARPGGRAMPTTNRREQMNAHVSIRARPGGRAMRSSCLGCGRSDQFQSAPGRVAGRCAIAVLSLPPLNQFQSAPGRVAGRCRPHRNRRARADRFNPRPAGWPGDAVGSYGIWQGNDVSIRARPGGRAMLHSLNMLF